jgi:hypothetical protein
LELRFSDVEVYKQNLQGHSSIFNRRRWSSQGDTALSGLMAFIARSRTLAIGYFIFSAAIVLSMHLILPVFAAPDEEFHTFHAAALSSGQFIPTLKPDGWLYGKVDDSIYELYLILGPSMRNAAPTPVEATEKARRLDWAGKSTWASFGTGGTNGQMLYLPQAIGLAIGRGTGLSVVRSYDLARILNALTVVGLASIANAGRGAFVLAVVLSTPMFLFLAASLSQDGILVAMPSLSFAWQTKQDLVPTLDWFSSAVGLAAWCMMIAVAVQALLTLLSMRSMDLCSRVPGTRRSDHNHASI